MNARELSKDASVRAAVPADVDSIRNVGHRAWRATYIPLAGEEYVELGLAKWWTDENVRASVESGRVNVAEVDTDFGLQVVGMIQTGPKENDLHIWRLYVLPEWQGSGLGSLLLNSAIQRAHEAAHEGISLSYMDGNVSAEQFYRRHGFEVTSREGSTDGSPTEVFARLDLRPPRRHR